MQRLFQRRFFFCRGRPVGLVPAAVVKLKNFRQRFPCLEKMQRLVRESRKACFKAQQIGLRAYSANTPVEFRRNAEPLQTGIIQPGQRGRGRFRRNSGFFLLHEQNLNATCLRIDAANTIPCPGIGVIMEIDPQQHIDKVLFSHEQDTAIGIVDAHGTQTPVPGRLYLFVIEAGHFGIGSELVDKGQDFSLLPSGNSGEGCKEVRGNRNGDFGHKVLPQFLLQEAGIQSFNGP